jgi:hypothetical protein
LYLRCGSLVLILDVHNFLSFVCIHYLKLHAFACSTILSICLFIFLCHISGCLWLIIGQLEPQSQSWLRANDLEIYNANRSYLTAVYWATYTLTTVGFGNIRVVTSFEQLFAALIMIIGSIFCANLSTVVGSLVEHYLKSNDSERYGCLFHVKIEGQIIIFLIHQITESSPS